MRILFLAFYYFPFVGAATWSTHAIIKRLGISNEVFLLIPRIEYKNFKKNYKRNKINSRKKINLIKTPFFNIPIALAPIVSPFFLFFKGIQICKEIDLIICQFQPHHFTFIIGILLGKVFHIPVIARANDVHREMGIKPDSFFLKINLFRKNIFNTINELFVTYADLILVVCSENKEILESRVGKLKNIILSPNGVDPQEFTGLNYGDARKLLQIKNNEKVILFIGRFSGLEYKIEILINSFIKIKREIPNSSLYLIGDTLPQKLYKKIIIDPKITVKGPVERSEIIRYIMASDICIGPLGRTSAIPLKVLEYMICGKPIVTGEGSISRDLARNNYNCIM